MTLARILRRPRRVRPPGGSAAAVAALGIAAALGAGPGACEPTEIRVHTEMGPDGAGSRRVTYLFPERDGGPAPSETEAAIPRSLLLPDRALWDRWDLRDRTLVAQRYFPEPSDIPSAYRWRRREASREIGSSVTFRHDDFVLFDRWVYEERFVAPVDRDAMDRALQEASRTAIDLATEALHEILGERYDLEDADRWLREEGSKLVRGVLLIWWEETRDPDPSRIARRVASRLRASGIRAGADELQGEDAPDAVLRAVVERLQALVKPLDRGGPPAGRGAGRRRRLAASVGALPSLLDRDRVQQALEDAGLRRFGTEEAFQDWVEDRIADFMGEFGGPGSKDLTFDLTLRLPGELWRTNGVILGPDEVLWRFSSGDLFPKGRTLEAESLVIRWGSLTGVSSWKGSLDRRDVLDLIGILGRRDGSPDPDLIEGLQASLRRRGSLETVLAPLRDASKDAARAVEGVLSGKD